MNKDKKILTDENYNEESGWDYDLARSYLIKKVIKELGQSHIFHLL